MPSKQFLVKNIEQTLLNQTNFNILNVINCGLRAFRLIIKQINFLIKNEFTLMKETNIQQQQKQQQQTLYIEIIKNFANDFFFQLNEVLIFLIIFFLN